jgi:hypothetical protein
VCITAVTKVDDRAEAVGVTHGPTFGLAVGWVSALLSKIVQYVQESSDTQV